MLITPPNPSTSSSSNTYFVLSELHVPVSNPKVRNLGKKHLVNLSCLSLACLLLLWCGSAKVYAATLTSKSAGGSWNASGTWKGGNVPSSTDDVIIDGPVSITSNVTCKSLTINSGSTLSFNTGGFTLTLTGTWITVISNSGTFTANDGTVSFAPSSSAGQTVSGTLVFNNVILNNVSQMNFGSASTVNGTIQMTNNSQMVTTAHPTYGSNSTMQISGTYSISSNYYLWGSTLATTPANIIISSGSTTAQQAVMIRKTLTVNSGATLNLSACCITLKNPDFQGITNNGTMTLGGITVETGVTWNIGANTTLSNLIVQTGATVNAGSQTIYFTFNPTGSCGSTDKIISLSGTGAFNAGTSTLIVNVSANGNATFSGNITLNNLILTGGTITTNNTGTNITINGNLTVNSGTNFQYGNTINSGTLNFGSNATLTNNGGTVSNITAVSGSPTPITVDNSLTTLPSSTSGGGSFSGGRILSAGNNYTLAQDMTITGTRKVLIIYSPSVFNSNGKTLTADSVYVYGKLTITNGAGMSEFLGSTKIYIDSNAIVEYASNSAQTISATSYGYLILSGSGTKTFASGTFTVKRDFTRSGGSVDFRNNPTFVFNRAGDQAIAGLAYRNVTFSGSGNKTLSDTAKVEGRITVSGSAQLVSNGLLTLVSNATSTASIGALTGSANVVGNVVSQRYIPSVARRYRMLSPNTASFSYADLKDNMFVTGSGGANNGFDVSSTNSASIFTYQESTTGGRGWKAVTNINQTLSTGSGAIVFVRGDRTLPSPAWYTPPFVTQNAVTLDFIGSINKGNITPTLTYTNTGNSTDDGYNLIGNPYPSPIDWSLLTKSNLSTFFYVLDPSTNSYVAQSGSTLIASGQGFFVKATAANPSLTFTESSKSATATTGKFKMSAPPLTIRMILDSINSDVAVLDFDANASDSFNENEDALKFTNSSINMGFIVGTNQVQINTVPTLSAVADTFTLFTNAASNNYRIEASNFDNIPLTKGIFLRDLFNNTLVDLRQTNSYTFNTSAATGGQGNRFQLIITSQMGALPVKFVEVKATLASNQNDAIVSWKTASEVNNEKFVIERSFDNQTFTAVGSIKGAGQSNVTLSYAFTDLHVADVAKQNANKIYYRIRQVDFSGESKISTVAVVYLTTNDIAEGSVELYPNPAKSHTEIRVNTNETLGKVTVYDITGKAVLELYEASNKAVLDVTSLNRGIYFVKSGEHPAQKLVVE